MTEPTATIIGSTDANGHTKWTVRAGDDLWKNPKQDEYPWYVVVPVYDSTALDNYVKQKIAEFQKHNFQEYSDALDKMVKRAKREALLEAADRCKFIVAKQKLLGEEDYSIGASIVEDELRRMAKELE